MKSLLIFLCLIAVIAAEKGKDGRKSRGEIPGCENPPKTELSECCSNFPKFFNNGMMDNKCKKTCRPKKKNDHKCCMVECSMEKLGLVTDNNFDASKAKEVLTKQLGNNEIWSSEVVENIINECVSSAPTMVEALRDNVFKKGSKFPKCSDSTTLNMAIAHCIHRELFFQCPGLSTSAECSALVSYGKGCSKFPACKKRSGGRKSRKGRKRN
ncbi:CLUMA_CG000708, isoform A [Clunio marinus]|uniref:CLUMA_CG000708, isoform A n=1 Tax=Clunio marinus TaxID=568069 RepID=A0A1J1HG88_9DIPT|nr:CLUMA_CG000708, isoform A [Clunio marinus]